MWLITCFSFSSTAKFCYLDTKLVIQWGKVITKGMEHDQSNEVFSLYGLFVLFYLKTLKRHKERTSSNLFTPLKSTQSGGSAAKASGWELTSHLIWGWQGPITGTASWCLPSYIHSGVLWCPIGCLHFDWIDQVFFPSWIGDICVYRHTRILGNENYVFLLEILLQCL